MVEVVVVEVAVAPRMKHSPTNKEQQTKPKEPYSA
jgi:hypothetical protein